MNKYFLVISIFIVSGCTMMPSYHRPASPVPAVYPRAGNQTNDSVAANIGWREFLKDPRLQKLVEIALTNNRDLRIAVLNVEQTRAQYRLFHNALLPSFEANGDRLKERAVSSTSGKALTTNKYNVTLDTAYEIDLFGRIRSLKAQVLEGFLATEEVRRGVHIALVSEVAIQYLNERALAEQLEAVDSTLASVENFYQLIKKSYELGGASELDLRSTEAQLGAAQANKAAFARQHAQAEDALAFLIGQPLPADLPAPQPLFTQKFLQDLPAGLPGELLERRPDILAAEHRLKAANANIGAVRAAFFPQITLTGATGTSSIKLAGLFKPGSDIWNFSPQITVPIFNRTNNISNLNVANIESRVEIAQYEKAVQTAFREVSDALIARESFNDQLAAQQALVKAEQQRYDLAGARYRNGIDSYLTVLTAQQDLYGAQQNLIQLEFIRLSNLVTLYKALGGGWEEYSSKAEPVQTQEGPALSDGTEKTAAIDPSMGQHSQ
jgi:multidrug efflux system outer membrane protein